MTVKWIQWVKLSFQSSLAMNLDSLISSSSNIALNRHNYPSVHQTMPQRSPFAIQELLGLSESSRQNSNGNSTTSSSNTNGPVSVTPSSLYNQMGGQTNPSDHHHQMQMASRMAYFNAHAAAFNVAAAFLPHSSGSGPLGLHHQSAAGKLNFDDI